MSLKFKSDWRGHCPYVCVCVCVCVCWSWLCSPSLPCFLLFSLVFLIHFSPPFSLLVTVLLSVSQLVFLLFVTDSLAVLSLSLSLSLSLCFFFFLNLFFFSFSPSLSLSSLSLSLSLSFSLSLSLSL